MSAPLPAIEELSARAQWVAWRIEQTADGKLTKVPYVAANGKHADSTDPATWTEYAIAAQVHTAAGHRGLGFVVTLDDPYCGIDLDHCRDPATREIAPWAIAIVKRFDSYVEISPSQTGLRIWIKARKSGAKCQKPMGYGKVEVYDHARFLPSPANTSKALRRRSKIGKPSPTRSMPSSGPSSRRPTEAASRPAPRA